MGHFAGEARLERIEQVCGEGIDDVLESLAQLVDTSLIRRTRGGRFELASVLRAYSRELLEDSGERDALCRRHAEAAIAEWLPLALDHPMTAYRDTYGPIVAEQADLTVLFEWAMRSDTNLFSQLIACAFAQLWEVAFGREAKTSLAEGVREAAATGPATGKVRAHVRTAAAVASKARGTVLETALDSDTEGDPVFAGWFYATAAVLDALYGPGPAWQERAMALASELGSSSDPDVRNMATILEAYLLMLQERWDEAADAFDAAVLRGGGTWAAESCLYMVGDCHLHAGRPQEAISGYARGLVDARDKTNRGNMGFQGEGIVAALVDLGRHTEALEALGACDTLTGEDVLPREHNAAWGAVMADRITAARAALGAQEADAAMARGRALGVDEVVELLLSYGATAGART
jgi:hypothetical protein